MHFKGPVIFDAVVRVPQLAPSLYVREITARNVADSVSHFGTGSRICSEVCEGMSSNRVRVAIVVEVCD